MSSTHSTPEPDQKEKNKQARLMAAIEEEIGRGVNVRPMPKEPFQERDAKTGLPTHILIDPSLHVAHIGTNGEDYSTAIDFVEPVPRRQQKKGESVYHDLARRLRTPKRWRPIALCIIAMLATVIAVSVMPPIVPEYVRWMILVVVLATYAALIRRYIAATIWHYEVHIDPIQRQCLGGNVLSALPMVEGVTAVFLMVHVPQWGGKVARCRHADTAKPVVSYAGELWLVDVPVQFVQYAV